jgi:hypothetical protein
MAKFYIRRADGRAYSTYGWTPDIHAALHYHTEKDAQSELDKLARALNTEPHTVEKVPPKIDAGHTRLDRPIFSGGFHG